MNELIIKGVECRINNDGVVELNLEHVARGLGFTQKKSGVEYVRWDTVFEYLKEMGFSQLVGKSDFIPESMFYKLCFKAKNEIARKFQDLVTDEILPSLRKHGAYMTPEKIEEALTDPDTIIKLAITLKEEKSKRLAAEKEKEQKIIELSMANETIQKQAPKVQYVDEVLQSESLISITTIAKDLGMSGQVLNHKLQELKVQYRQNNVFVLHAKYQDKGYTKTKTHTYYDSHGVLQTVRHLYWTEKGRALIYSLIHPVVNLPKKGLNDTFYA